MADQVQVVDFFDRSNAGFVQLKQRRAGEADEERRVSGYQDLTSFAAHGVQK